MDLAVVWFILIAVLWTGYFVLEGFDFGVGALLGVLGRASSTRSTMLATIGPVWDGNEVWLITAAGATFAAFPAWYSVLFSGFYLPLLCILVALIIRAVGLEFREKRSDEAWRSRWDVGIAAGSVVPAFGWGLVFANVSAGIPIDASGNHVGSPLGLLNAYAILGGAATLALFCCHGAVFLALKTTGTLRAASRTAAARIGLAAIVLMVTFLAWTALRHHDPVATGAAGVAAVALIAAVIAITADSEGWAFCATAVTIVAFVAALFVALFPEVMPSTIDQRHSLTIHSTASGTYTLTIMSVVAAIFTPLVMLYQGWTYWVFRQRLTAEPQENETSLCIYIDVEAILLIKFRRRNPRPTKHLNQGRPTASVPQHRTWLVTWLSSMWACRRLLEAPGDRAIAAGQTDVTTAIRYTIEGTISGGFAAEGHPAVAIRSRRRPSAADHKAAASTAKGHRGSSDVGLGFLRWHRGGGLPVRRR